MFIAVAKALSKWRWTTEKERKEEAASKVCIINCKRKWFENLLRTQRTREELMFYSFRALNHWTWYIHIENIKYLPKLNTVNLRYDENLRSHLAQTVTTRFCGSDSEQSDDDQPTQCAFVLKWQRRTKSRFKWAIWRWQIFYCILSFSCTLN